MTINDGSARLRAIQRRSRTSNDQLTPLIIDSLMGHHRVGGLDSVDKEGRRAAKAARPVDALVNVVNHALTARRPRRHYVVGKDAKVAIPSPNMHPASSRPDCARDSKELVPPTVGALAEQCARAIRRWPVWA